MDEQQKNEIKQKIQDELKQLEETIVRLEESTRPVEPNVSLGRLTRMEAIASKGVNEAALNDARERLRRLNEVLQMIDSPEYGICRSCHKPIATARLEFMPETTLCVECA